MGIESIPDHYLIMHQFLYQAEKPLRRTAPADAGGIGVPISFTGNSRRLANELKAHGWRRADHWFEGDDGELKMGGVNRFSVWYKPQHWKPDRDVVPPVVPYSQEAGDFLKKIRQGRTRYPDDVKLEIMDAFISFLTNGKMQHWNASSAGTKRALYNPSGKLDRPDTPELKFPKGVPEEVLIPGKLLRQAITRLMSTQRRFDDDPVKEIQNAEKGLEAFGWSKIAPGNPEKEVWYSEKHWDAMLGGELGLEPLTDEAKEYQSQLPEQGNVVQRHIPDPSMFVDVDRIISAAAEAGKAGATRPKAGAKPPPSGANFTAGGNPSTVKRTDKPRNLPKFADDEDDDAADPYDTDDIDAATAQRKAELSKDKGLVGQPPGRKFGGAGPGKPAAAPKKKAPPPPPDDDEDDIPDEDEDLDDEDLDDDEDDDDDEDEGDREDIENMSLADLEKRYQQRTASLTAKKKKPAAAAPAKVPANRPRFADDDE